MTTLTPHPAPAPVPPRGGNVAGRMTALTLFTPIRRQWTWALRLGFAIVPYIPMRRHIIQFNFIKFVRWVVVKDLDGEKLHYPYLFFESNFDGPWQHYIDAFAYIIPADIRFVWGRGPGFPGPPPAEPLKAWIAHNSMEGGTYYCAHPDVSTRQVQAALSVDDAFARLRRNAAGMDAAQFGTAWRAFLTEQQSSL